MPHREMTKPFVFFFLVLPYGISSGFISITLPFVLTRAGFSVAIAASIVAIGVSANLWRFLWGPVADLTLTARRWYLIGLSAAALTLFLLGLFPLNTNTTAMLMAIVFVSQVASTFIVLPVGGLMAHTVAEEAKGRAAGWYQAGNLGGTGIGGGAGVWLASHYSKEMAGEFLSLAMLAAALALFFVSDVRLVTTETIRQRLRLLGRDIFFMLRSPIPLFTIVLIMVPIGAGAMNNVWSAVAPDWRADPKHRRHCHRSLERGREHVWMCGGRLDRRSRRALVGLLRFGHSDGARNDRDGSCPAYVDRLRQRSNRLRIFWRRRLRCVFRSGPICDWTRCRVDEIRSAFVARQRAGRLHDRAGWLGA